MIVRIELRGLEGEEIQLSGVRLRQPSSKPLDPAQVIRFKILGDAGAGLQARVQVILPEPRLVEPMERRGERGGRRSHLRQRRIADLLDLRIVILALALLAEGLERPCEVALFDEGSHREGGLLEDRRRRNRGLLLLLRKRLLRLFQKRGGGGRVLEKLHGPVGLVGLEGAVACEAVGEEGVSILHLPLGESPRILHDEIGLEDLRKAGKDLALERLERRGRAGLRELLRRLVGPDDFQVVLVELIFLDDLGLLGRGSEEQQNRRRDHTHLRTPNNMAAEAQRHKAECSSLRPCDSAAAFC